MGEGGKGGIIDLIRLARPHQWAKGVFVLIGPVFAYADQQAGAGRLHVDWLGVALAFIAFGFASSSCYIINDIKDRDADRAHPRKMHRPIASGRVAIGTARVFSGVLLVLAGITSAGAALRSGAPETWWLPAIIALYVANVVAYSLRLKQVVMLDVICLSIGFVLRVIGGCVAAGVEPSSWLLNCTFFVSMFLAFGKRLGERRSLGDAEAAAARGVQGAYTSDLLRMAVVVTAVASLLTYAGYIEEKSEQYTIGFNLLWLTILPATYGLLRAIVVLERGRYDDPTELAVHDRPFQAAAGVFGLMTLVLLFAIRAAANS